MGAVGTAVHGAGDRSDPVRPQPVERSVEERVGDGLVIDRLEVADLPERRAVGQEEARVDDRGAPADDLVAVHRQKRLKLGVGAKGRLPGQIGGDARPQRLYPARVVGVDVARQIDEALDARRVRGIDRDDA
ncbi:MAG: hypothetical protein ACOX6T_08740 [Myxococcales bacterium]